MQQEYHRTKSHEGVCIGVERQPPMDVAALALLLEPAAWLGGIVTVVACLCVLRRHHSSDVTSLDWYLGNWRMRQVFGVATLFYVALTASCVILHDRWGWLYGLVALRLAIWWYKRLLNEDITFSRLLGSRSRA
ncbi:MAG TPA: hypothetical protein VKT82_09985 [Ktedonobacterales bacterium]|nr:hypothetical protein [Ktedonobacterales bacterium]